MTEIPKKEKNTEAQHFDHVIKTHGTNQIVHDKELDLHTKNISILDDEIGKLANVKFSLEAKKLAFTAFAVGTATSWAGITINQLLSNLEPQIFNYIFFPCVIGMSAFQTLRYHKASKLCDERAYNAVVSKQNEEEKYQQRKTDIEKQYQNSEYYAYR